MKIHSTRFLGGVFVSLLIFHSPLAEGGKRKRLMPPPSLAIKEVEETIRRCAPQVAPATMKALTRHESAWRPYSVSINRPRAFLSRSPENIEDAVDVAKRLIAQGYNVDLGFAQINSANLQNPILLGLGVDIGNIFDVCTNVRAGEAILVDCFLRAKGKYRDDQRALVAALSCYNTGNFEKGIRNGYVTKVFRAL